MHVVILAVHLDKLRLEVGAHAGQHAAHVVQNLFAEYAAAVFGHKDQMDMNRENAVSPAPIIVVICLRPFMLRP